MDSIYQQYTLQNGIRLVHKQTQSRIAHCGIMINAGTREEEKKENGLAHFLEHCFFKGTEKRKAFHILNRMDSVGADLNAYTSKEETCFHASFLTEYYDRTLDLFSDIIFHSVFPEKEIEREKTVVIDEINSYLDDPSEMIFDEFELQLFKGHPIGQLTLGKESNILKFKSENLRKFILKHYTCDQIVISSVGNIPFKQFIKFAERYFGGIQNSSQNSIRSPFSNYQPITEIKRKRTNQTHCIIGNIAYDHYHPLKTALTLLNNILGGPSMNSRLSLHIREKHGLTYQIGSNYSPFSDTGLFTIYMGTAHSLEKTLDLVEKELGILRNQKMGTLQLTSAKKQLIGQVALGFDSNLNEMISMAKSTLIFKKIDSIEEISQKIEDVTAEQLQDVAQEVFDVEKFSRLIYTSK